MQVEENIQPNIQRTQRSVIRFATGDTLFINEAKGELALQNSKRQLQMVINITEDGLVVNINASQLNIHAEEQLNLSANKINIKAAQQLTLQTGGNLVQQVGKDLLAETAGTNKNIARVQKITASLGNIELRANDDVKLDGESVKLNCEE